MAKGMGTMGEVETAAVFVGGYPMVRLITTFGNDVTVSYLNPDTATQLAANIEKALIGLQGLPASFYDFEDAVFGVAVG